MARWVKSKQSMRIFKTSSTPSTSDGLAIGDIWVDTTSGALLKVCTNTVGPTFSTMPTADAPTFTTGITTPKITFNSTSGIIGTTTNDSAAALSVGEYIESVNNTADISLTNVTTANVLSISLTAGDWDVSASIGIYPGGGTVLTNASASISATSATQASVGFRAVLNSTGALQQNFSVPSQRVSIASTTTVYLVCYSEFTVSTATAAGSLIARRVR